MSYQKRSDVLHQRETSPRCSDECPLLSTWAKAFAGDRRRVFRFPSSAHVLAFSVRARQLAEEAGVSIDVIELAGKSVVTLRGASLRDSRLDALLMQLDAAAGLASGNAGRTTTSPIAPSASE